MPVKRNAAFLFSLALLAGVAGVANSRSNSATRAFNDGVKYFNANQYPQAIVYFDEAISSSPDFAEALYARGASKYYVKAYDNARMDLNAVLRLEPGHLQARSLRGALHYEADRWDEAVEDFNAVLTQNPREPQALLGRGIIRLKRQELEAARRDLNNFLRVKPDDPIAPQVKKVLASLPAGDDRESDESQPVRRTVKPTADYSKLADSLTAPSLSDVYNQKAMRGEKPQAVGDIYSVPTVGSPKTPAETGYEIVEPR